MEVFGDLKRAQAELLASDPASLVGRFWYHTGDSDLKYYNGAIRVVVNLNEAQTLLSKTLTTPTINGGTLDAAAITGGTVAGTAISGGTISGGTIGGTTVSTSTLVSPTISGAINFGDPTVDGSWRLTVDSGKLVIEKRVSSAWVKSQDFEVV